MKACVTYKKNLFCAKINASGENTHMNKRLLHSLEGKFEADGEGAMLYKRYIPNAL